MFGAACTLNHMGAVLKQAVETLPPHQTEVFLAVLEQLRWFAGQQIRNVAVSRAPRPVTRLQMVINIIIK